MIISHVISSTSVSMPQRWRILIYFNGCKTLRKIVTSKIMVKSIETPEYSVIPLVINLTGDVFDACRFIIWCTTSLRSGGLGRRFGIFTWTKYLPFELKLLVLLDFSYSCLFFGYRRSL